MAVNYTIYRDGTKESVTRKSGAIPNTHKHKVFRITSGGYTSTAPNFIAKIKCVDTEAQWTNVDLTDINGDSIGATMTIEESDEVIGPFRTVTISGNQDSGSSTTSITSIMIWEKIIQ